MKQKINEKVNVKRKTETQQDNELSALPIRIARINNR